MAIDGTIAGIVGYLNTTFILGAGTSRHTGAPLISDFLAMAMKVMDDLEGKDDALYRVFDKIFVYIAENDALESLLGCNFKNIEDVFGLLDLEARVIPSSQPKRDALLQVILHTLARTIKSEEKRRFSIACEGPRDVAEFDSTALEVFASLVANRPTNNPSNLRCGNAIISLNYDTLVEAAMMATGVLEPDYGSQELSMNFGVDPRSRIQILKLHGSTNWRTCPDCRITKALGLSASVTETPACQCGKPMSPMLIPPSWDKGIHAPALKRVWQEAYLQLKNSRQWVFIGTSLPATDQYLRYLFAIALRRNVRLRHVIIVDPGDGANIKKLFEKSASRVHLEHLPQELVSALGGEGTPSSLFRQLQCFAPAKDRPYEW